MKSQAACAELRKGATGAEQKIEYAVADVSDFQAVKAAVESSEKKVRRQERGKGGEEEGEKGRRRTGERNEGWPWGELQMMWWRDERAAGRTDRCRDRQRWVLSAGIFS